MQQINSIQFTNIGNDLFTFSHIESSGTGSAMRCHSSLKALTSQLDSPIINIISTCLNTTRT